MYRITYVLGDLRDPELARQQLLVLFGALVESDVLYLRSHPKTPTVANWLSSKTARYDDDAQGVQPSGQEAWQDIPTLLRTRRDGLTAASNRDLTAWRAAELIVRGVPAEIRLERRRAKLPNGSNTVEVRYVVALPDGRIDDPSRGQGWRAYAHQQRVTFVIDLFSGDHERKLSHATLNVLLHALTYIDVLYLRRHPETPRIYASGVVYMEEPPGMEEWQDIPTCIRMGIADCEDLACWRGAELQVFGDDNAYEARVA